MSDTADRLWGVVEQYVAAEGIELDDLVVVGSGTGTIVRITVDADSSVSADHIASLTRGISRLFDDEDPFSGSYTLEVSTPGLERKLRLPAHFAKSVGREAKVKVRGQGGFETLRGVITSADAGGFVLTDDDDGERFLEFGDVTSASTIFEWQKTSKSGTKVGR